MSRSFGRKTPMMLTSLWILGSWSPNERRGREKARRVVGK
jgi:hypothetical protein